MKIHIFQIEPTESSLCSVKAHTFFIVISCTLQMYKIDPSIDIPKYTKITCQLHIDPGPLFVTSWREKTMKHSATLVLERDRWYLLDWVWKSVYSLYGVIDSASIDSQHDRPTDPCIFKLLSYYKICTPARELSRNVSNNFRTCPPICSWQPYLHITQQSKIYVR